MDAGSMLYDNKVAEGRRKMDPAGIQFKIGRIKITRASPERQVPAAKVSSGSSVPKTCGDAYET